MYVISHLIGAFISIAVGICKLAFFMYFLQRKKPFICTLYQLYIVNLNLTICFITHNARKTWWVGGRAIPAPLNLGTAWR